MSRPFMQPAASAAQSPEATISCLVEAAPGHPLVDFVFTFRGGSAHDPPGLEGRLSLMLATLLRGTRRWNGTDLEDAFDRLGADVEVELDAECVRIQASVLPRNAEALFAILAECVLEPSLEPAEIERQRRAMIADLVDARNDDDDLAARAFCRRLFLGHAYGRPTHGTSTSLERVTHADVLAAHREIFVRNDLVVGAAGAIRDHDVRTWIDRYLGTLPAGPSRAAFPSLDARLRGRHAVLVDKPERTRHAICAGTFGTHPTDRDHHALLVANTAFGGMYTGRMAQEIRVRRGWSYDAHSSLGRGRARQSFAMIAMPSSDDLAPTLTLLCTLVDQWVSGGLREREIALAKKYVAQSFAFELDTPLKRLEQRLLAPLWNLPADHHRHFVDRIRAVTLDEANAAIERRIDCGNMVFAVVASADAHLERIRGAITNLASCSVHPYDRELEFGSE